MNKLCLIGAAALIATSFLPESASAQRGGGGMRGGGMGGFHGGGTSILMPSAIAEGRSRSARQPTASKVADDIDHRDRTGHGPGLSYSYPVHRRGA